MDGCGGIDGRPFGEGRYDWCSISRLLAPSVRWLAVCWQWAGWQVVMGGLCAAWAGLALWSSQWPRRPWWCVRACVRTDARVCGCGCGCRRAPAHAGGHSESCTRDEPPAEQAWACRVESGQTSILTSGRASSLMASCPVMSCPVYAFSRS
ncbi:hypothetical protein DFH27DRAFT_564671 [Peziza echinospora]|nr:hypothetical protein DFH27DRAFT_564671 [Peziza echinospora]